jgi:hypothetical protein
MYMYSICITGTYVCIKTYVCMYPYISMSVGHGSAVQLCEILPNGTYAFGSDPRAAGHAVGY